MYTLDTTVGNETYIIADFWTAIIAFAAVMALYIIITTTLTAPMISFLTDVALSKELYTVKKTIDFSKKSEV